MPFSIRTVTPEDLPYLTAALDRLNDLHHQAVPEYFKPAAEIRQQKDISLYGKKDMCFGFVAQLNERPIGMLLCHIRDLISPISAQRKIGSIDELYVEPKHQSKGIGKALVAEFEQLCRQHQATDIFVEVWEFNQAARHFYQSVGMATHIRWLRKSI
ncbi:GNAT family N-acetyltransferase [Motilimonas pumila]|nr:GNAT family N-acetyltransferase [Motilimonas pumila]